MQHPSSCCVLMRRPPTRCGTGGLRAGVRTRSGSIVLSMGCESIPSKVGDAKVFRTWGWTVAFIVSEEIEEALERIGATGVKFKEV
jgi:hypothetical protein